MSPDAEQKLFENDILICGTAAKIVFTRAWWNPMRWLRGKYHQKRIDLNAPRKRFGNG
jgi:hypothetical protein